MNISSEIDALDRARERGDIDDKEYDLLVDGFIRNANAKYFVDEKRIELRRKFGEAS
ncbi:MULTISPECIES: hypothetical protein [unclassified Bradyrhizobium]|uniref:hypothetical protein n=1 Tax=unclassified Bradyrhizobium TaxID=2631580 RepID=UPI00339B64F4